MRMPSYRPESYSNQDKTELNNSLLLSSDQENYSDNYRILDYVNLLEMQIRNLRDKCISELYYLIKSEHEYVMIN